MTSPPQGLLAQLQERKACPHFQELNAHSPEEPINSRQRKDQTMNTLKNAFVNFLKDESGPTAVEYAVMLALIIVVCIAAITALGTAAKNTFSTVADTVAS